jgi:hypothetical protein
MTKRKRIEQRRPTDDAERAAVEACELLGLGNNPSRLCPADRLRVDMVSALRLVIDHAGEAVLDGGTADLGKLVSATEHLARLLPKTATEPAQSHRADPRKALLEMILEMRDRDEVGDLAAEPTLRERIAALETENTRLRAALAALKAGGAGKAVADDVPEMVERVPAPAAKNVVPLKPSSAPAAPEPPSKPFVNGLSDVPQRVRDTRPANEPWRRYTRIE